MSKPRLRLFKHLHCPHIRTRGIYGDEINNVPRFSRIQCLDCGNYLDGPVSWAGDHR